MCTQGGSCGSTTQADYSLEALEQMDQTIMEIDRWMADMRRYLFRNVACEARKSDDLEKHRLFILRGWT